jgi:hypothetical protein
MMELPSHLKALPPGALEMIQYLSQADEQTASREAICADLDITERGFGKIIRRLVTKSYVIMDGDQLYRLTDQGSTVAEEIAGVDLGAESDDSGEGGTSWTRHIVLVLPEPLQAGTPAHVILGFESQPEQDGSAEIVARLSVINGEPDTPQEAIFELDEAAAQQDFLVTAGSFTQARLKVEIYQIGPNEGDISVAGGMYVDVPVSSAAQGSLAAYGADIMVEAYD